MWVWVGMGVGLGGVGTEGHPQHVEPPAALSQRESFYMRIDNYIMLTPTHMTLLPLQV